jgi:poly-gamma-glutamate synthesis protein (capsule biosynthesis protein)
MIAELKKLGIAYCGAGMDIDEARRPALVERGGTKFGFLSYNCTGPIGSWAKPDKPGCAWVRVLTAYELEQPCPGSRPRAYSFCEPDSLKAMTDDIEKLRPDCDILVVHFHKGIGFEPVVMATYEQPLSYAAIDAGADLVLGDHAHILKGIEQYKGKTIFHNLSHFGFPSPIKIDEDFIKHLGGPYFFGPGGKETPLPVHEVKYTIIARCTIMDKRISRVSYLPCMINEHDQPEIVKNDERGSEVFEYVDTITRGAGMNAVYTWDGDEVVIGSG